LLAGADTVEVFKGGASMPDTIYWDWQFDPVRKASFWQEVQYTLHLSDHLGQTFDTPPRTITGRQTEMEELEIEKIPIILFGFDDDRLDLASARLRKKFQHIAEKLKAEPAATCALYGHTDEIGETEHNFQLAGRRAKNVMAELVALGIAGTRLSAFGFGETQPLADNRLPEGRMLNRRVEVHIRHTGEAARK
jgi:outer membrane protein OmpA-like peptidoglycan-associated protein